MSEEPFVLPKEITSNLISGVNRPPPSVYLPTMPVDEKAGLKREWQDTLNILRSNMSSDFEFSVCYLGFN